jgi:adenylate kinase
MKSIIFLSLFIIPLIATPQNFVLIGPPGAGKGTFSNHMAIKHKYHHINPGTTLRAHIRDNTSLGQTIKPIVEKGDFVDVKIICKIIDEEITYCLKENISFVLDGFPSNHATFEYLVNYFKEKEIPYSTIAFVYFAIDDQSCLERIKSRLTCSNCGTIFNTLTYKPQKNMTCDFCGTQLEARIDNIECITRKRLNHYRSFVEPLAALAKSQFIFFTLDATLPLNECIKCYEDFLKIT